MKEKIPPTPPKSPSLEVSDEDPEWDEESKLWLFAWVEAILQGRPLPEKSDNSD